MKRIIVVVSIVLVLFSQAVMAEDAGTPVFFMDTVVVTASKYEKLLKDVPQSVTVITEEEIAQKSAKTLDEILKDVAGLQVQNYGSIGSQASISMRGMTSSQVLVLIDGRPVNKFQDGVVDFSKIPVSNISSIEIVRGAASSLYGSNAMGGVINIITKKEAGDEVHVSYGTYNTSHSDFTVSHKLGGFVYSLTAAKDVSKGDRPNSLMDSESVNLYTGYSFSDEFSIDLRAGYYNARLGLPGMSTSLSPNDKQFNNNNFADFEINMPYGIMLKSYTKYDTLELEIDDWFGVKQFTRHANRESGSEVRVSRDITSWNHLVIGGEYRDYQLRSTEINARSMHLSSGYFSDEISVSDLAVVTIGGRHDSYKSIGSEFSPSAAILVYLPGDTNLRFSAGGSFRVPTFNDLYWPSTMFVAGNPNLTPEKGVSYDIGVDTQFSNRLWARVGGFYNKVDDLISWAQGTDTIWRPYNVSSAKIRGLEAELKTKFFKYVTADVGYTLLDTENSETKKPLIYNPDNKVDVNLNITVRATSLTFGLEHVGKRYHNNPDTNGYRLRLHEYTVYNASLSHGVSDTTELYIKGENLLDKKYSYQKDYPLPGAAMYAGMKIKF